MKRALLVALSCFAAAGCATSDWLVGGCIPESEWPANASVWQRIARPEASAALIALRNPAVGREHRLVWHRASDGRLSACNVSRYGNSFVIYSSEAADARVLEEGSVLILVH